MSLQGTNVATGSDQKPCEPRIGDKAAPCPLDHVNRQFQAARPNALWLSDFTYVATWTGFVYVAFVIDAYARRIVGGARHERRTRASCSMRWSRLCMTVGRSIAAGWCIIAIEAANTSRSNTPSACSTPWRSFAACDKAVTETHATKNDGHTIIMTLQRLRQLACLKE